MLFSAFGFFPIEFVYIVFENTFTELRTYLPVSKRIYMVYDVWV